MEMKKEMTEQEAEDQANFNGHPHGMKDPEALKKVIEEFDRAIVYHEKKREILRQQYELMAKYPKPLDPKFEYETQDEWVDLIRQQHELNIEPKLMEVDEDIRTTKDRKRVYEEMLATDLAEVDAKEKLQQLLNEKIAETLGGEEDGKE